MPKTKKAPKQGRARPRKKDAEGGGALPWIVGTLSAAAVGWGAYRLLGAEPPAPEPQPMAGMQGGQAYYPQQQQAQDYPGVPQGMLPESQYGHGVMGMDEHGIPEVALPAESASRTMQARRYMVNQVQQAFGQPMAPQPRGAWTPPVTQQTQGQLPQGIPVESFGGSEGSQRGSLGGENF